MGLGVIEETPRASRSAARSIPMTSRSTTSSSALERTGQTMRGEGIKALLMATPIWPSAP